MEQSNLGENQMMFSSDELKLYEFYESLSYSDQVAIDEKLNSVIVELRKNGITEGDIYELKCIVAKDLYNDKVV